MSDSIGGNHRWGGGVVQATDGNMLDQVAALKAIADDVGNRIHHGYLPKHLIWQTL
jgi:hypothetical protein